LKFVISKSKKYKSPGTNQIEAELIQAGSEILPSAIHKLINSIWNKEELPDQWNESITLQVHKRNDKTDSNNYREISRLSTSYKIIEDHQCGFRCNRSTTDQIFAFVDTGECK
jgi:hypothetical protein